MIHRAILGSFERLFGILLEHHKGNLPFFLSPVQARILPITDNQAQYGQKIVNALKEIGVRVDIDTSTDPIRGQIKRAQEERIPWMLVVGKKEEADKTVTLRYRDGSQDEGITLEELVKKAQEQNV